ncbi:hypothetical protein MMC26_003169 [Xylographa opegraphella]|nr:hypothetical protein [Xylographa opegraphella]
MRNLRNTRRDQLRSPGDLALKASGWDIENESIICAYGPTKDNSLIQLKRWHYDREENEENLRDIASWDAPCPLPDLECDNILDVRYFSESSTICIVLAGGDIIVVREAPSDGQEKIEIVGTVDVGISAAAWSPDEELLTLLTRADTLLYMTKEFDNISSVTLAEDDLKASKHVSVGWGKKETQFKGKGAKALRDPTMPEKVDEGLPSAHDDNSSTISWRGDGAYLAVNSNQASPRRVIRVYSREADLDGVSEPVDGLEGALSWRPDGNLLAGIQRFDDHVDVVFFERNGLRHGQFPLRIAVDEMTDEWATSIILEWNVGSSILAVCFRDRVQLWTMGNYYYYLKQELSFTYASPSGRIGFQWNPEHPLMCTAMSEDSIHRLEYVLSVDAGSTISPDGYGIVAVIDGTEEVKLTPFRLANVPPPMAFQEVSVKSNIVHAAIYGGGSNTKVAVLERDRLTIYRWNLKSRPVLAPILLASAETAACQRFVQQVVFVDDEQVLVLATHYPGSTVSLFRLTATDLKHVRTSPSVPFAQSICLSSSRLNSIPCLHFSSSGRVASSHKILESGSDSGQKSFSDNGWNDICVFPKLIREVKIIDLWNNNSETTDDGSLTIAFGLTPNGSLYANSRRLAKDCTSFLVTPAHLIFTTTQNLLKFVHMVQVEELEVPPDTPEIDERCRSVERGARLVTVMPSISALILQMPRGNLETIYPRALVLPVIRQHIDERKYKKAFLSCRSHRVDMNILHDHDPEKFIKNVDLFVGQVGKVEHIDLFLSQLREEDVSKTIYKDTIIRGKPESGMQNPRPDAGAPRDSGKPKINIICDAFLQALQPCASTNLQNIITAHVCKSPPDLEAGLLEVAKLQSGSSVRDEKYKLKIAGHNSEEAEKAVEHICFLVDVNRLYDNALGLYNLELALLVAQQSQKDPREYLPFLQQLQELPPNRKEYAIDDYLGRYTKALMHLHAINDFEESTIYMTKHKLYEDALRIYRWQDDRIQGVMGLYAEYLRKEANFREAGIAYEFVKNYAHAAEAYQLAHLWQEALSCAGFIPLKEAQLQSFASIIAGSLQELKDYHSAAIVHQDYLHDLESAARLFCKGYFYADAIRILSLNKRPDLVDTIVDAGLVEGMGTMTELLAECRAQFNAQVPRLRELRIKKVEEPLAFFEGDANNGMDIPDNVSLAPTDGSTTGGSLFTRYTNRTGTVGTNATRRTSKNKRREERKRARGKKGSVYEEEYLVNSIGRLIERVNAVGDEVGRLVAGLMRRGMRERAKAVEGAMVEVVGLCRDCVGEVFQSESKVVQEADRQKEQDVDRPTGGDGVLWDSMEAKKEAPEVKAFEKLALFTR